MSGSPLGAKSSPTSSFSISPPPRSLDDDVRASSLSIFTRRAPLPVFSESKSVHISLSIVDAAEYHRTLYIPSTA